MTLALNAAHKAVYQRLVSQLPCSVYNHVPQDSGFPYVVVGEKYAESFRTKSEDGQEITIVVHAWSKQAGDKECSDLAQKIYLALDRQEETLSAPGYAITEVVCANTQVLPYTEDQGEPDHYYHAILRFRVLIEDI